MNEAISRHLMRLKKEKKIKKSYRESTFTTEDQLTTIQN